MGKKYIVELPETDSEFDFASIRPYAEPDLEQVRKEAYEKGLSDAWDAARKIGSELRYGLEIMGFSFEPRAVGYDPGWYVVQRHSASECIAKIRQYELFRDGRIPSEDAR